MPGAKRQRSSRFPASRKPALPPLERPLSPVRSIEREGTSHENQPRPAFTLGAQGYELTGFTDSLLLRVSDPGSMAGPKQQLDLARAAKRDSMDGLPTMKLFNAGMHAVSRNNSLSAPDELGAVQSRRRSRGSAPWS